MTHRLVWYRQKRFDGAIRTAVDVDDVHLLHQFENTSSEPDPALLWFVDLRCEGLGLPTTADEARNWLLKLRHSDVIRRGFQNVAEELRAGIDMDTWPVQRNVAGFPGRIKAAIAFSAVRRLDCVSIAEVLLDIAAHWDERMRSLPAVELAGACGYHRRRGMSAIVSSERLLTDLATMSKPTTKVSPSNGSHGVAMPSAER